MDGNFDLKVACRSAATTFLNETRSFFNKGNKHPGNNGKPVPRKGRSCMTKRVFRISIGFGMLLKITSFLVALISILYVTETIRRTTPTDRNIFKLLQNLRFDILRTLRFVSLALSLHKLPPFQDAHTKACLLFNPFLELIEEAPPCHLCEHITEATYLPGLSSSTFRLKYLHKGTPFIVRDAFPTPIQKQQLEDFLFKHLGFQNFQHGEESHMEWYVQEANLSRVLRTFFPLPNFIPINTDVYYQHYVHIDGPSSPSYPLPLTDYVDYGNVFIMQAQGRRLIQLIPVWRCKSTCSPISILLEPGHVLYFSLYFWRAASHPVQVGFKEDDSIMSMGGFFL